VAGALLVGAAFGLAACGESSPAREGGALRASYASFPDFLDPQLSYTFEGWTAMYDTYIPLLTLAHASGEEGSRVVPGLAESLPEVSGDGKTYTLKLRDGLRYSDGAPVRASDFEATVERLFLINSPGIPFYTDIVGAERFLKSKRGGIAGIETDDETGEITIRLVRPRGTFTNELAMMFLAVVPAGTPARDQTAEPPPATGPYEIVEPKVGRAWSYARNPEWAEHNGELIETVPDGHVDAIEVDVVRNDNTRIRQVEQDQVHWTQSNPPADLYASVKEKYEGERFRVEPLINTYFFWMNTQRPPFDDVRVRRAVNYAVDRAAFERIYAGSLVASHQVLPVGMPGHRTYDLYPHDMAKAKRLLARADPADREIVVWGNNENPNNEATAYYQGVLEELGFDAEYREVNADNYFALIGNENTPDVDTGWMSWFQDYPHPNGFFEPLLSGDSIQPTGNNNVAHADFDRLDAEIDRLGQLPMGPREERDYAALDREYMAQAPWVPYGSNTTSTFVSSDVDFDAVVYNPTYGADLTSFQFK
jgi:peptide/nickel transport system substrate-binding protein